MKKLEIANYIFEAMRNPYSTVVMTEELSIEFYPKLNNLEVKNYKGTMLEIKMERTDLTTIVNIIQILI